MRRQYLILGAIVAVGAAVFLLWPRRGGNTATPEISKSSTPEFAVANSNEHSNAVSVEPQHGDPDAEAAARTNAERDFVAARDERMRLSNEADNPPVAFFGEIVDQDSNALQSVAVDIEVTEEYVDPYPQVRTKTIPLQRQTGADGRFEVSGAGLKGKYVVIKALTKAGYEQEFSGGCGIFGPQGTSFENPAVLKLWSTNMHEPLISGEKSFGLVPDGRHYAIDFKNSTITEGEAGDLVVWTKLPQTVVRGERYAWSCEVSVPSGGLLENENQAMFMAPESGYTNPFAFQEQEDSNGRGCLENKRFYIQLSNGMYGRIVISLYPDFHWTKNGLLRISYAINPSGSRLLR